MQSSSSSILSKPPRKEWSLSEPSQKAIYISRCFSNKCHFRQWSFAGWLVLCCWIFLSQWLLVSTTKGRNKSTAAVFCKGNTFADESKDRCYHVKTQSRNVVWSCNFSWLFLFSCLLNVWHAVHCCSVCSCSAGEPWCAAGPQRQCSSAGAGWVRGGQSVFHACLLLYCLAGCLPTGNSPEITYHWSHRSPARTAVWELGRIQAGNHY